MENKICRLCSAHLTQYSHSLLENPSLTMFEALTMTKVQADKGPKEICTKCFLNLSFAYKIQQSIIKAEEKLQLRLSSEKAALDAAVIVKKEKNWSPEIVSGQDLVRISEKKNCIICGEISNGNAHVKAHFRTSQYCKNCDSHFEDFDSYKGHLATCQLDETCYDCSKCGSKFQYKSFYDMHVEKLHAKSNPAEDIPDWEQQRIEQLGISLKPAIRLLLRDKRPKEEFRCGVCSKLFKSKASLGNHTHRTRQCPICKKDIAFFQLGAHVRDHQGPQICEMCGAQLKNPSCLRQHIFYTHSNLRYKCEECGKEFRKRHLLTLHMKKHRGEKNHVCEQCGKSFFDARFLKRHVDMTHLKLRPNICKYCKRGFSSAYALKTHERQHTNETPFWCDVCGDGFRQKVSLKSHKKSKHGIVEPTTVNCEVCHKGFGCEQALLAHSRLHL